MIRTLSAAFLALSCAACAPAVAVNAPAPTPIAAKAVTAPTPFAAPSAPFGFGVWTHTAQSAALPSFAAPWKAPYYAKGGDDIDCHGALITSASNPTIVVENVSNIRVHNCKFTSTLTQLQPARIGDSKVSLCAHAVKPLDVFGCGVPVLVWGNVRNVYIDHNDMTACGEKCIAVGTQELAKPLPDGTIPAPDGVTVALNTFRNSYFGMAVMAQKGIGNGALPHPMHITVAFNLFDGIYRRSVRGQSASAIIDETNNVIRNWTWPGNVGCYQFKGFGPSALGSAQLLLRANMIDGKGSCPTVTDISDYIASDGSDRGVGFIKAQGDLLLNGAVEFQSEPANVTFTPPAYPVLPAAQVAAFVQENAGVKP